jgi:hypothetical protein
MFSNASSDVPVPVSMLDSVLDALVRPDLVADGSDGVELKTKGTYDAHFEAIAVLGR